MISKLKNLTIFVFLLAICTACPYESEVPVSEPLLPADPDLYGKWLKQDATDDFFQVKKRDRFEYLIVENVYNQTLDEFTQKEYAGYLSQIGTDLFLNVRVLPETDVRQRSSAYFIYKIEKRPHEIVLYPLTENIQEKFSRSDSLAAFIAQHGNLSFFYGPAEYLQASY